MTATITPDGARYMAPERPAPFHARWLIPALCGPDITRWVIVSRLSLAALAPLAWWFTGSPWMAVCPLLPGVWYSWRHPVLVDAPAMALALLAACLWPVSPLAACAVLALGAATRETVPVWVAIYAWSPLPLLALVVPLALQGLPKGPDPARMDHLLAHPIRTARQYQRDAWNARTLLAPWGGLLAGLAALDAQLAVALAAGYGQLLVATDRARLFQWAWPVLAAATVHAVPAPLLVFVALAVALNPWGGDGL